MTSERIQRALAEATREARSEGLPAIDWEAVEERLPMTRVATIPPRPVSYRPYAFAAALALVATALGVGWNVDWHGKSAERAPVAKAPVASTTNVRSHLDGNTLAPGSRVSAGDVAQSVMHEGHVQWTLAPHSTAVLVTRGEVVAIRLEVGSVSSRVVKSSQVETFAVEAADVRIAAHGTEFVVTLGADGVSVTVSEGTVLVGPREEPGVGELLASPAAKRFTRAGKPLDAEKNAGLDALRPRRPSAVASTPPNTAPAGTDESTARAPDAPRAATGSGTVMAVARPKANATSKPEDVATNLPIAGEALAPERASPEALESSTRDVIRLAAECFKQRTATSDGVRIMAQTTVTFRTTPEGRMKSIAFEPPLSPWVQVCVNAGMGSIHAEPTRYGFQVSRTVDLER